MEALMSLLRGAGVEQENRRRLLPGEILIKEGESQDAVYVLVQGRLVVSRLLGATPITLATISEPGTIIGEMVSLGESARTASIAATEPSELIVLSRQEFNRLLVSDSNFATEFAHLTARRAEENELAELLAEHFGLADDATLASLLGQVEWHRLSRGDVLITEGEASDAIYFVVRGRLLASRFDHDRNGQAPLAEIGQGEVVGETGILRRAKRNATVVALRETVLAALRGKDFYDLIENRPQVMLEVFRRVLDRTEQVKTSSPGTILAVVVIGRRDGDQIMSGLEAGLTPFGTVESLGASRVASLLGLPAAADTEPEGLGDARVSRLLHEAEIGADHLLLAVGTSDGRWSQRCLEMADRVVVFIPADPTDEEQAQVDALIGRCPDELRRILVRVHPAGSDPPSASARWLDRFAADEMLHVVDGSNTELARVARVVAGRGTALVLSGGGGRGFAHIGVSKALYELGIPVDIVGGTSIGGIFATVIADLMPFDEIIEWASRYFPKVMDYTIPLVSLIKAGRIARSAESTFGDRSIEDLWRSYFCVSSDLTASRPYVHRRGSLVRAIRATSAIPGVMPPVPEGDHLLVDGGVLNNLPVDIAREMAPVGEIIA
ncbi:MAG TPA: cyclic nucleotide-binding domain-containing protein, partial [Acidimicrobiia bacterium]|nr:cyclic nucleotide-binding domain-containing protein [Acidimicrobiia bacterium]